MTTSNNDFNKYVLLTLQQMMAESYWADYFKTKNDPTKTLSEIEKSFIAQLKYGNTRQRDIAPEETTNTTKATDYLAEIAYNTYEIIDYKDNDETGFAGMLIKNKNTNEYTFVIRSTEYGVKLDPLERDLIADKEIGDSGFAFAELMSMEKYYQYLKQQHLPPGATLNVSGYSLGGHLASSFYLMHKNEVNELYLENAPGIGYIGTQPYGNSSAYNPSLILPMINFLTQGYENFSETYLKKFNENGIPVTSLDANGNPVQEFISKATLQNTLSYIVQDYTLANSTSSFSLLMATNTPADKQAEVQTVIDSITYTLNGLVESKKESFYNALIGYAGLGVNNMTIYDDYHYIYMRNEAIEQFNTTGLSMAGALINQLFIGVDSGQLDVTSYDNNDVVSLYGDTSKSMVHTLASDYKFVAQSQIHPQASSVYIEDQPEVIGNIGKLPLGWLQRITRNWTGDFGTTHSITLLQDSLLVMDLMKKMQPSMSLDDANAFLNSYSTKYAERHIFKDTSMGAEDNVLADFVKDIVQIVNLDLPTEINTENVTFPTTSHGFADLNARNELHKVINKLNVAIEGKGYTFISLDQYSNINSSNNVSLSDIMSHVNSTNEQESKAWKYALLKQNPFVLQGAQYDNVQNLPELDNDWSEEFWKQRSYMLLDKIKQNQENIGLYLSNNTIKDAIDMTQTTNMSVFIPSLSSSGISYITKPQFSSTENWLATKVKYASLMATLKLSLVGNTFTDVKEKLFYSGNFSGANIVFGTNATTSYAGSSKNDYIFTGNGNNTIALNSISPYMEENFGAMTFINASRYAKDYLETGTGENTISAGKSFVDYNLKGKNTISGEYLAGTIKLNGKTVTGGIFDLNEGLFKDANFSYQFISTINSDDLKIQDLNDANSYIIIKDTDLLAVEDLGINLALSNPVTHKAATYSSNVQPTSAMNPFTSNVITVFNGRIEGGTYSPQDNSIAITLPEQDITAYREGNDLYLLNDNNMGSFKFVEYFDMGVTQYETLSNGSVVTHVMPRFDAIELIDKTYNISGPASTQPKDYEQYNNLNGQNIVHKVRPYDKIIVPLHVDLVGNFSREGNNLIYKPYHESGSITYKNYFTIGNFASTGIFYKDYNNNANLVEFSRDHLAQMFSIEGSSINEDIHVESDYKSAFGGDGFNRLFGDSDNNTFIVNHTAADTANKEIINGGEGGNDVYKINLETGRTSVQIADFKAGDKLYLYSLATFTFNLDISGNDLIIKAGNGQTIKLKNYLTNRSEFGTDSGIYTLGSLSAAGQQLPLATLEQEYKAALFATSENQVVLDSTGNSDIKEIYDTAKDNQIIVANEDSKVYLSTGHDTVTKNSGSMTVYAKPIAGGSVTIKNFDPATDKLNITYTSSHANTQSWLVGTDLYLKIEDYLVQIEDYGSSYGANSSTGLFLEDGNGGTTPITAGQLEELSSGEGLGSTQSTGYAGGYINFGINTTLKDGKTSHGSAVSDHFQIEGSVQIYTSSGIDVFDLSEESEILTIAYTDVNYALSTNKIVISLDETINQNSLKYFYNPQSGEFSIYAGQNEDNNPIGVKFTNFPVELFSSFHDFVMVKHDGVAIDSQFIAFQLGDPFDELTDTVHSDMEDDIVYAENQRLIAVAQEAGAILYGSMDADTLQVTTGNNLLFGDAGEDLLMGNFEQENPTGSNLIISGMGDDEIFAGKEDVLNFYADGGNDTVHYSDADHISLNIFKGPLANTFAISVKSDDEDLIVKYNHESGDSIRLKNYWSHNQNDFSLYLNAVDQSGSDTNKYSLADILDEMGIDSETTTAQVIDYSDIASLVQDDWSDEMLGGVVSDYFARNETLAGLSVSAAKSVVGVLDNGSVISTSLYNNPSDPNKL